MAGGRKLFCEEKERRFRRIEKDEGENDNKEKNGDGTKMEESWKTS